MYFYVTQILSCDDSIAWIMLSNLLWIVIPLPLDFPPGFKIQAFFLPIKEYYFPKTIFNLSSIALITSLAVASVTVSLYVLNTFLNHCCFSKLPGLFKSVKAWWMSSDIDLNKSGLLYISLTPKTSSVLILILLSQIWRATMILSRFLAIVYLLNSTAFLRNAIV